MADLLKSAGTLLVVDDEASARSLLSEILSDRRYKVLEAENGRQALELLKKHSVDLILTDRTMPDVDGLQLLQQLRDDGSTIPVIMVSAYGEDKLWQQALALGALDYLVKPFQAKEVLDVIDRYLKPKKGKK